MATHQSKHPPEQADSKLQTSEVVQTTTEVPNDANLDATKETASVFVNSEPMREEQVQNAVKFLSHPKVRGSPVMYRRSFLEKKGLTKEEIDEAFRRVPDPPPTVTTGTSQDGQLKPSSNTQSKAPAQALQPQPSGVISKVGTFANFRASHALIAIGFLAVSGAGTAILLKKTVVPRLKSWIRKVMLEEEEDIGKKTSIKPSLGEEAAAAAKAAAAAATDAARASQEMLIAKTDEKRYFEELMKLLEVQVQEMKSMSSTIRKLEGQSSSNTRRSALVEQEDHRVSSWQPNANGKQEFDTRSVRSSSPPASVEPSVAPHPKSYMDIMSMIQRGERPSNIREINDLPPNPNQPVSNPRLAPRSKPWEVAQPQNSSSFALQTQDGANGFNSKLQPWEVAQPHNSSSYAHQTQDGANGYNSKLQPWEVTQPQNSSSYALQTQDGTNGFNSKIQDNGVQLNGDTSSPWWQGKNVRITEVETEDEPKTGFSSGIQNDRPVQRSWVPPQPPPVAMPEAAAAIRQPKKSPFQNEQLNDDQLLARTSDITDELQRITKISESGGALEANGGGSKTNVSEIQEENGALE